MHTLKWQRSLPKEPGHYWVKMSGGAIGIVQIAKTPNCQLVAWSLPKWYIKNHGHPRPNIKELLFTYWAGPIPKPEDTLVKDHPTDYGYQGGN